MARGFKGTPGRPLKGGVRRRTVQAKIPAPIHELLVSLSDQTDVVLADLGAFYLIAGWNEQRTAVGLTPIPMPDYLVQEMEHARRVSQQDVLGEALLEAS